ncbi:hypothetical protein VP01_2106g1 [Puccinia sorghi]|uniref:BED-type domain-containing protein n=1 Tax=Puccinia sorghi TaxID=27349 RepID=A0A0L6VAB2_9BASI|nr:hypothetical protein VP01_2106g1 [Puccinia sorghi]
MSDIQKDDSRRQKAKCNHCQKVFNQGKPHLPFYHIKDSCPNIPPEEKSSFLSNVLKADSTSQDTMESSDENQVISVSVRRNKKSHLTESAEPFFQPWTTEKTHHLHKLLLKSLVSSNVLFTYLENPYFQECHDLKDFEFIS